MNGARSACGTGAGKRVPCRRSDPPPTYIREGPWPHFLGPEQCPNEKLKILGKEPRDQ